MVNPTCAPSVPDRRYNVLLQLKDEDIQFHIPWIFADSPDVFHNHMDQLPAGGESK